MTKWTQRALELERVVRAAGLNDPEVLRAELGRIGAGDGREATTRRRMLERRLAAVEADAARRAELEAVSDPAELAERIIRR